MLQKILNIGVSDVNGEILNRKIRISNLIAFLSIVILFSFLPLSIYLRSALSLNLLIFFAGASFLNFYLHTKKMHIQAFYTYTFSGFIYFIFATLTFGLLSNLHYFMLVMCMISVVIFDRTGANNLLLILRNNELVEFKANKQPIGKVDNTVPFTTHTIELQKGDLIYTFTDGFADQFGGPKGKKFKYAKLKELLISIHSLSLSEQSEKMNTEIESWKGNLEQVDDILLIGIKV